MAIDFQVVFPQQVIQLTRITVIPGLSPRTLDVLGADFRSVDEVLINDMTSPSIVVLSQNRLMAEVPEPYQRQSITSVSVLSRQLTLTKRSLIRFRVGHTPSKVRGVLRLLQVFLKILFTTPGTDIFSPRIGGAGLAPLGATFGRDQGGNIVSSFIVAVDNTTRQIVAIQGRDASVPRDERLLTARVLSANFNPNESALITSVEITSQAGQAATANVVM